MEAVVAAQQPLIKMAALCGSLCKASFNCSLIHSGIEIEYIDIAPLPMLNTNLEVNGTYPHVVEAFHQKILAADYYLFASPEYNYSVSGEWTRYQICATRTYPELGSLSSFMGPCG
ncbi:hypothetical protein Pint_16005 [Pistacia integerrima]|uniref:Uncharacterized protein n=1 Tax=Pistacia integerrima TaxID=434235 RepID=A0ACC0Z9B8_9ROSI|nr:hypothetical protein Pint_16005 [Pistacia integerrima]